MKHTPEIYGFRNNAAARFPEMVVVAMSFVCNARCIHCPNAATGFSATLKGPDRLMSWDVLKAITGQCAPHPTLMRISSFGEILMHPEAMDMITYILENKPDKNVALTTNGFLLTRHGTRRLMEAGIKSIEFSIDAGSREIYEKIRVGLTWETTLQNILDAMEIRNRGGYATRIMVSVIEQPDNKEMMDDIFAFWESRVDQVLLRKLLSFKGVIHRRDDYPEYMPPDTPCPFLWERVVIDPLGNVRGCVSDLNAEFVIGNMLETRLETLWHCPLIETYRKKHLSGNIDQCPMCNGCVDLPYRSWNYNYFYALDKKYEDTPATR
jgi:radical SAM protein with 4Fe4S-binding SPASM domain